LVRDSFATLIATSADAQFAQHPRQCRVLDRDVFLFDQFLVHSLRVSVTFVVQPFQ